MPGSTEECPRLRACSSAGTLTTVDGPICAYCGKDRPLPTKGRRRSAAKSSAPSRKPRIPPGQEFQPPTGRSSVDGRPLAASASRVAAKSTPVETMGCSNCDGVVGAARWANGHRECTRCAPLKMVAVGLNKAAPDFQLASTVTAETVASGRRRP